jgi:CRAL/TRIO domain
MSAKPHLLLQKEMGALATHIHTCCCCCCSLQLSITWTINHHHGLLPAAHDMCHAVYSPANAPALSTTLSVLHMLANHYPERLHKAYIVNAPAVFQVAYKVGWVLRPLLLLLLLFFVAALGTAAAAFAAASSSTCVHPCYSCCVM